MNRYKIVQDKWDVGRCDLYDLLSKVYFTMYQMQFFYTAAAIRRKTGKSEFLFAVPYIPAYLYQQITI